MADAAPSPDGRRLRSIRSRDAVVDALLALYQEGHLRPGASMIAERAGVSQSSVFRLFENMDDIVETAIRHQWVRMRDRFEAPSSNGPLFKRIATLVAQRVRIHDAAGPAIRAGRVGAPESKALREAFAYRRRLLRAQVADQFAAELARLPASERRLTLDALDVATGLEQVEALRIDRNFSAARTASVLTLTVQSLLDGECQPQA